MSGEVAEHEVPGSTVFPTLGRGELVSECGERKAPSTLERRTRGRLRMRISLELLLVLLCIPDIVEGRLVRKEGVEKYRSVVTEEVLDLMENDNIAKTEAREEENALEEEVVTVREGAPSL